MATGGGDAVVSLWDLDEVVCTRGWAHMDHPVRSLSLSADGRFLAYATELGELEVLSTTSGARLAELRIRWAAG
jgi:THO complex subunit 3